MLRTLREKEAELVAAMKDGGSWLDRQALKRLRERIAQVEARTGADW